MQIVKCIRSISWIGIDTNKAQAGNARDFPRGRCELPTA